MLALFWFVSGVPAYTQAIMWVWVETIPFLPLLMELLNLNQPEITGERLAFTLAK